MLTPTPAVLAAIVGSQKSVLTKIPAHHRTVIAANDAALYLDMKMGAPYLNALLDMGVAEMKKQATNEYTPAPIKSILSMYAGMLDYYKRIIVQLEGITVGLRLSRTGVVLDEYVTFLPGSDLATIVAAYPKPTGKLLNKLPASLPWVLALGAGGGTLTSPEAIALNKKLSQELIDIILADTETPLFPPAAREKLANLMRVCDEQIRGGRFYAGGATPGAGLFGIASVLEVKDAAAMKAALADLAPIAEQMVKALVDDEDVKKLSITYTPGVATIAGVAVDAIEINHPEIAEMKPDDQAKMIKVLGEAKIRIYIATPDNNTVVVTFGGGQPFLAKAIAASVSDQDIAGAPGVAAALAELPPDPIYAAVFSAKNLLDVIKAGVQTMAGPDALQEAPWPMIQFSSTTPIAAGGAIIHGGIAERLFIPTDIIAEGVKLFISIQQDETEARQERNRSVPREDDF